MRFRLFPEAEALFEAQMWQPTLVQAVSYNKHLATCQFEWQWESISSTSPGADKVPVSMSVAGKGERRL